MNDYFTKDTKLVRAKVSTEAELLKIMCVYQAETGKRLSIDEAIAMLLNER
jgi:hypothetical protein